MMRVIYTVLVFLVLVLLSFFPPSGPGFPGSPGSFCGGCFIERIVFGRFGHTGLPKPRSLVGFYLSVR
ncbi:MAG: hypothetical protein J7J32_05775 [Candidatus Atribacteria bacterium]|nr:hypothetical protein [Candidatus Atribacteria bacterium]MCD6350217.1 hypothetical protein [Candidatus Atribacteria bacterium]